MKRALGVAIMLVGFSLVAAGPASAQWSVALGAGALVPTSDYGDFAKTGWGVGGNIGYAVSPNVGITGGGFYGSNDHETEGEKTNLIGFGGGVGYTIGDPETISPIVFGGAGFLGHQFDPDVGEGETDWQGYVAVGAGLVIPLGGVGLQLFGEYLHGFDETTLFAIGAGIGIPLGGDM